MNSSSSIVDELLYEEESQTLDFKEKEYNREGASDEEKSELIKDILAFVNAWRRTDAYIMIGVREIKGGKSEVIGISKHIDDADLQQFVNSKTQLPVTFSYKAINYESKQIGLIHIPLQERPIYLKKDYGRLRKNTVYIRRGSSTEEAKPDEIAKMGIPYGISDKGIPILEIQFADTEKGVLLGNCLEVDTKIIALPTDSSITDYVLKSYPPGTGLGAGFANFYKELAKYWKTMARVKPLNLAVTNSGGMVAHDVRVEITIENNARNVYIMSAYDLPDVPDKFRNTVPFELPVIDVHREIQVKETTESWIITIDFNKIQPKRTEYTESKLYIGAQDSSILKLDCKIYADNLPDPIIRNLEIKVKPEHYTLTVEQLVKQG